MFHNFQEAKTAFAQDMAMLAEKGVFLPEVVSYLPESFKKNWDLAMDAQPQLQTTPNSAIPAVLNTLIDPDVVRVIFAPKKCAIIFGEERKGNWLNETALFPVVEHTSEVTSYDDYANNGSNGTNVDFENRQAYLFQSILEVGDRELERMGLAKINYVSEKEQALALGMNTFQNTTYFFGVGGLVNYGLLNDPSLSASLTPGTKAAGGVTWFTSGGAPNATANEVYNDIQAIFKQLVAQTGGTVDREAKMTLALGPETAVAMDFINSFGLVVRGMLKTGYPNMKIETAVQYDAFTSANVQGNVAGNFVQLIADDVEGEDVGYCAFNEKMRAHPIVRDLSSFRKKVTGGTWGAIVRYPAGIASMVGV